MSVDDSYVCEHGWTAGEMDVTPAAKVDHFGIVVPDLHAAAALYLALGCDVTEPMEREGQGIAKIFVGFANMTIELIAPTTPDSPLRDMLEEHNASDFLASRPAGGLHHVCYTVADLSAAREQLAGRGYRMLGTGGEGRQIAWLDPESADGVLIELKQAEAAGAA